jgi:Undecaprenyl-phosphate galactose phosphotransferase WbaP
MFDDDVSRHQPIHGVPVIDSLRGVRRFVLEQGVHSGIVALADIPSCRIAEVFQEHAALFRTVFVIPALSGVSSLWVQTTDIGGILGLELRDNLLQPLSRLTKRLLDLILLVPVAVVVIPLGTAIILAIKLTTDGPVFYGQTRIGKNGVTFRAWKFRTMVTNADQVLKRYLSQDPRLAAEWLQDHKLKRDPRVTRIGTILRRISLDELPQLWNVVLGQMSFVGPRPIVNEEISKYGTTYRLYSRVTPGITGLWQVSGRNNTTYEERVNFDEYYVRNWSVWLDIHILARTVRTVLTTDGAY